MNTKPSEEKLKTARHLNFDRVASGEASLFHVKLEIFTGNGCDEGAYYPAQNVTIPDLEGVRALHSLCTELLTFHAEREDLRKNNS